MSDDTKKDDKAASEDAGKDSGKPDLNAFLEEWKGKGSKTPEVKDDRDAILAKLGDLSYRLDIPAVISQVKGDLDVSDKLVENYVNGRASRDERLLKLWDERETNRDAWDEALGQLHKELASDLGKKDEADKDKDVDKDDKGLAAAARMARDQKTPGNGFDNIDWGTLSDQDLALKEQEIYRLAKAGQLS